ncbi:hypothetical protein HED55_14285 [Ochrobactrum haematophilum]|uniref:Uncharacterized protein n=1 Tax=Brucella haematophila TaxID=419474 RepID=A0ABX1DM03_9HYPH|nr:hypothetical protein [Brucella haematophila]
MVLTTVSPAAEAVPFQENNMISNGKSSFPEAEDVIFGWYDGQPDANDVAEFFVSNVSPTYISHTDIQWGRASGIGQWSPGLRENIEKLAIQAKGKRVRRIGPVGYIPGHRHEKSYPCGHRFRDC